MDWRVWIRSMSCDSRVAKSSWSDSAGDRGSVEEVEEVRCIVAVAG